MNLHLLKKHNLLEVRTFSLREDGAREVIVSNSLATSVGPCLLHLTTIWKVNEFLVADTQLYKRLCPSIGPSVRPSVGPSARVEKWENAHNHPCQPVCNWWPCIWPCFPSSIFFSKMAVYALLLVISKRLKLQKPDCAHFVDF